MIKNALFISFYVMTCFWGEVLFSQESPNWEKVFSPGLKVMYKSKTYADTFLSEMEQTDTYDLKSFDSKVYVENLADVRENAHKIVKIVNYKIFDYKVKKLNELVEIELQGSYLRGGNVPIQFCEIHTFNKNLFNQKQISFPASTGKQLLKITNNCFSLMNEGLKK